MGGYPLALMHLDRRRCVVVGGGAVATRKVVGLIEASAQPVIISPTLHPELERLVRTGQASAVRREYRAGDIDRATVVIAATDDGPLNARIAQDCDEQGILVNVVDTPELCSFYVPSIVRRGELSLAISTGGGSPAFARHVRETLEPIIDAAFGDMLAILAALRPRVLQQVPRLVQGAVWQRLLDGTLMDCLRAEGKEKASAVASRIVDGFVAESGADDD